MWHPRLETGRLPLFEQLLAALRADIAAGRLSPGERLPPQRDLAHSLGVAIGTVTRAYGEAQRQGLITAHVGRGAFVSTSPVTRDDRLISLNQALPPSTATNMLLAETLARVRRRPDLLDHLAYAPPPGFESHRRAGAAWVSQALSEVDWRRLVCCNGAHQAIALSLAAIEAPLILCEAVSYWGLKALAQHTGAALMGLALDHQGLTPQALERAASETGARVVYLTPTLQNPTGRVMDLQRRHDIVAVARAYNLWIIEDDIYALYGKGLNPTPLASLAPERTFYIGGLSKALAPGLRAGYLVVPTSEMLDRVVATARALSYAPPGLSTLISTQMIEDGSALTAAQAVWQEMAIRTALAMEELAGIADPPAVPAVLSLWAPMPELAAERLAGQALRAGVELMAPSTPIVTPGLVSGLRISLGAPNDHTTLRRALQIVRAAQGGSLEAGSV